MKSIHVLADAFDRMMVQLPQRTYRRCGYRPTYLRAMVAEQHGVQVAKMLLAKPVTSSGFMELLLRGAVDLTVEALVTLPRWRSLFTAAELAIAESRLQSMIAQAA